MNCIFCKIIDKKVSARIVYEDDDVIAFNDISPAASVHVLIIPKKHINAVSDINKDDTLLMGKLVFIASEIAKKLDISSKGYKLLFRVGKEGGQEIEHIHLHLLGGKIFK